MRIITVVQQLHVWRIRMAGSPTFFADLPNQLSMFRRAGKPFPAINISRIGENAE